MLLYKCYVLGEKLLTISFLYLFNFTRLRADENYIYRGKSEVREMR